MFKLKALGLAMFFLVCQLANATGLVIGSAKVIEVFVNGGVDSVNSGTTCFTLDTPVSSSCASGVIGIPNNNSQLLSALLTLRTSRQNAWVYYEDSASNLHCPGIVFTPCSLISISIK